MNRSEIIEEYVNEKMDKLEGNKKEEFEGCRWCLEFLLDVWAICAILKILFFM